MDFIQQSTLVTAIVSWAVAQILKVITVLLVDRKVDFTRLVGAGGMPSSHSAFVTALALSLGLKNGFVSDYFSIAAVLAFVVMYDAAGVRRAAGEQAKILNKIIKDWGSQNYKNTEVHLKELLGHTPMQVIAGALLGAVVAILRHLGM